MRPARHSLRDLLAFAMVVGIATLSAAAQASGTAGGDGFSAGLEVRPDASAVDIGLPVYPGAVPQPGEGDDSPGATLGLWGGSVGFRLRVLKFASPARLDEVTAFYRGALAKFGPVLDCAQRQAPPAANAKGLDCEGTTKPSDGVVYKAGRRGDYRMVSVQQVAGGVRFQLVRIEAHTD